MSGWGGSATRRARAHFAPLLPLPCSRCGLDVYADQRWQVDHLTPRALGGTHDLPNLWPAHGRCNEGAGGKLGHQLRAVPVRRVPRVRRRSWA